MGYKYNSRRQQRKYTKKSRKNFFITLILIIILMYVGLMWILPTLIGGLGSMKNLTKPEKKAPIDSSKNSTLAPPILSIPYEATNTGQINVKGYGTPSSKVSLFVDDDKKDTVDVSSDGAFEFKNITLSIGTNNIYGKSVDENNLESLPSKNLKILFDDEKPTLSISEPEDDKKIQGGGKKIKISGTTEADVRVYINDTQAIVSKDGNFSQELPLNEGENNFNIKVTDKALNSTEISRKVTYTP
jgi:hypothetical protein